MSKKPSKADAEWHALEEATRQARIRPTPAMSFSAGPIDAHALGVIAKGIAEACAAMDSETVLFAHAHSGESHRNGVVFSFYPWVTFEPAGAHQTNLEDSP